MTNLVQQVPSYAIKLLLDLLKDSVKGIVGAIVGAAIGVFVLLHVQTKFNQEMFVLQDQLRARSDALKEFVHYSRLYIENEPRALQDATEFERTWIAIRKTDIGSRDKSAFLLAKKTPSMLSYESTAYQDLLYSADLLSYQFIDVPEVQQQLSMLLDKMAVARREYDRAVCEKGEFCADQIKDKHANKTFHDIRNGLIRFVQKRLIDQKG